MLATAPEVALDGVIDDADIILPESPSTEDTRHEAADDAGVEPDQSVESWAIPKPPRMPEFAPVWSGGAPRLAPSLNQAALADDQLRERRDFRYVDVDGADAEDEDDDDDEEETPPAVPGGRAASMPLASIAAPAPDDETGSVLITGICGRLGKLLVRELHRDTHVVGIDRRAFPDVPKDVVLHRFDLRRKKTRDVFRSGRVRAVVHLGVMHDPRSSHRVRHGWNVVAFQKLLEYMAQYRVRKLVVLSSANVYGPHPENPQFLTEEAPLLGSQEFYAIRDLVELDMLAQGNFWKNPDVETVILRPCHILGEVRNAPSNYLRLEKPVTILGFDPMVQVIHERDVVSAIRLALEPGVRGIFNIRGQGELPLSRMLAVAGRKPFALAAPLAEMAIQQLWRLRLGSFPAREIDHIRYLCMVDDTRARQTFGWAPRYSLEDAVAAALAAA